MAQTTATRKLPRTCARPLNIPGYKIEPRYVVRLPDGSYYRQGNGCGPDLNSVDAAHATQFLVRDGEWNANGWARRLNGAVEEVA